MTESSFGESLRAARAGAFEEAARALKELGFAQVRDRRWAGRTGSARHSVVVELPEDFPDTLPTVYLAEEPKGPRIAHVETNHKVCLASESATLVDTARIGDVIRESLARAEAVLNDDAGHQEVEIEREFLGYWDGKAVGVVSICPPDRPTGEVRAVQFRGEANLLVAVDVGQAKDWLAATQQQAGSSLSVWFAHLESLLPLPKPGKKLRFGEVVAFLEQELPAADYAATIAWLRKQALPVLMVFSSPVGCGGERAVYALQVPKPEERGFRAGTMPSDVSLARARGRQVLPVSVERADAEFLLARGGGTAALRSKTVLLAGCGAVGSHLAVALGAMGVGRVILVDPEVLGFENIHRHALGAGHVGQKKVEGLKAVLRERFPHQVIEERAEPLEKVLELDERLLDQVDLVILALGAETLERRLAKLLKGRKRVVHTWLEPHGVGGHVLVTGPLGSGGCFCCLFRHDAEHGMVNEASLVEPNQKFQRSAGGCAGTFTPFGVLDAERTALEAAREISRVLKDGDDARPRLTSWAGSAAALGAAGFRASPRGVSMAEGSVTSSDGFAKPDCEACSVGQR